MRFSRRARRRLLVAASAVVGAGVCLAAVVFIRSAQQSRLLDSARAEGLHASDAGDYPHVLEHLSYYLQHVKDDVEVLIAFAHARVQVPTSDGHHVVEALGLFRESLRLLDGGADVEGADARIDRTLRQLVELYGLVGMRFEQIKTADRILRRRPDDVSALSARALAFYGERRFEEALEDAERLSDLEPQSLRWREMRLEILRAQGRPEHEILALCRHWSRTDPLHVGYQVLEASLLAASGSIDEARTVIARAAEQGAETLETLQAMTALLDALHMPDVARMVVASARERFPHEQWVREAIVHRHWRGGSIDQARAELESAAEEFPALSRPLQELRVLLLVAAGDEASLAAARAALRAMREQGSGGGPRDESVEAWARALEARLDLDRADWEETVQIMQHAALLRPEDPVLHFIKGEAYAHAGEAAQAADAFGAAFGLDNSWIAAGARYAQALLEAGRVEESLAVSRHVLARADRTALAPYVLFARAFLAVLDSGAPSGMGSAMLEQGGSVVRVFEGIAAQLPEEPDVAALLVEVYVRTGKAAQAKAFLEGVLARERPAPGVLLALSQVSLRHGLGFEDRLVARARTIEGLTVPVAFALASIEARGGRHAAGLAMIDQALAADRQGGGEIGPRQARVRYLIEMGHPDALAELRRFVERFQGSPAALSFVLGASAAWSDRALIESVIDSLAEALGERAQMVRLAKAAHHIRYMAHDEAALAEAIMLLTEVLEVSPQSQAALTFMAEASMLGANPSPQRAIEHLERAVAAAPGQSRLYAPLIELLQGQGEFETAERYLEQLHQVAVSDEEARRAELRLLQRQGDFETALVRAGAIFDEEAGDADQLVLAAMHRRAGQTAEAQAIYEKLLAQGGAGLMAVAQAASFYAETGRFERGLRLLLDIQDGSVNKPLLVGSFHRRHGRLSDAAEWLERATLEGASRPAAFNELARLHLDRGDAAAAIAAAERGLAIAPEHLALRGTLAVARLSGDDGARAEALSLLRDVGSDDPDLLALLTFLERVPRVPDASGRETIDDKLLADARRLLKEHGSLPAAWNLVIRLHHRAGEVDGAIDLSAQAVARFPAQPEPALWATQLLMGERRWQEALVEAEEWRRRTLHDPMPADLMMARILLELARPQDALGQLRPHESQFMRHVEDRPDGPQLYVWALLAAGRHEDAAAWAAPLLAAPQWRRHLIELSGHLEPAAAEAALAMLGQPEGGEAAEVIVVATAWQRLGLRSGSAAHFDRAEACAAAAEADGADPITARLVRAAAAEGRGDLATAERVYRDVIAVRGEHALALNNLAFVLLRAGRATEALPFAEKALALVPASADVLDTYGNVLRGLRRLDEAEQALRRAVDLRPAEAALRMSLVEVFIEQGNIEEASASMDIAERDLGAAAAAAVTPAERQRAQLLRRRIERVLSSVGP